MGQLILLRHGQSKWNELNQFTGWVDVDLSPKGIQEALEAGRQLADYSIDVLFTSTLVRAQMTATLAMSQNKGQKPLVFLHAKGKEKEWGHKHCLQEALDETLPVHVSWHLNERYYGDLQGMNKDIAREKFGKEQVHIWRRSYDISPPNGESLKMTKERTLPYFKEKILPLCEDQTVLIVAHGNSLRSIVMELEKLTPEEIIKYEIPTGKPLFYHCQNGSFEKKA